MGFLATAISAPTFAQADAVEPDDCIELAAASIYGAPPLESSVAVGCGAEIEKEILGYNGVTQPLAIWKDKDGNLKYHTVRVDCGPDNDGGTGGVCSGKGDAQIFVKVKKSLYDKLANVGDKDLTSDDVVEVKKIMNDTTGDYVPDIDTYFQATGEGKDVVREGGPKRVENAVAVGSGSKVHQAGGVAIGQNATVGGEVKLVPQTDVDKQGGLITGFEEKGPGGADGIAIGNDSKVTGDNGIAIGAKVSAGKDQIRIGAKTQRDVWIGAYDLSNLITAPHNHEQIWTNKDNIAKNLESISANTAGIAGNRSAIADLDKRLRMVDERVSEVAAMAAALSAVPNAPDRDDGFFFGVGVGHHDGESGVAVGISGRLGEKKRGIVNFGVATSGGETTLRAGIGWSL